MVFTGFCDFLTFGVPRGPWRGWGGRVTTSKDCDTCPRLDNQVGALTRPGTKPRRGQGYRRSRWPRRLSSQRQRSRAPPPPSQRLIARADTQSQAIRLSAKPIIFAGFSVVFPLYFPPKNPFDFDFRWISCVFPLHFASHFKYSPSPQPQHLVFVLGSSGICSSDLVFNPGFW